VPLALALMFALKTYAIQGVIRSRRDDEPLKGALVVLECTCLEATLEASTNEQGRYHFGGLPPGTYTIRVLKGEAAVAKIVTLPL
jgi:hypothetical protein